jgi:hypothetical protein
MLNATCQELSTLIGQAMPLPLLALLRFKFLPLPEELGPLSTLAVSSSSSKSKTESAGLKILPIMAVTRELAQATKL